jgi:membrane protein
VTRGRTWSARIVQYWAAITLAPIFIITAIGMTGAAQYANSGKEEGKGAASPPAVTNTITTSTNIVDMIAADGTRFTTKDVQENEPGVFERLVLFFRKARIFGLLLPFVVLTLFLTLFYRLMPATKVRWGAAAVGGAVGGGLLQLNNMFSVIYLSRVVSYSKIYGSLGAVPIFLLGLYFSWLIILLGAQVAYAYQNRQAYIQEKQAESINQRGREFVAIRLMAYIAQSFYAGERPPTRLRMSQALGIPSQLACSVLCALVSAKLLVEAMGDETGYSPARPIEKISLEDILGALRAGQGTELATADDPTRAVLREQYERVVLAEMHAAGAVNLQQLVTRIASLPQLAESNEPGLPKIATAAA